MTPEPFDRFDRDLFGPALMLGCAAIGGALVLAGVMLWWMVSV